MKREEILELSRTENKNKYDEYMVQAKMKASNIVHNVLIVMLFVFYFVADYLGNFEATRIIFAITSIIGAVFSFVMYCQIKNKWYLVTGIGEVFVGILMIVDLARVAF